jgi:LacI family transcriptional regulator
MESVNIKKLAQLLGLSIATVSKALRDSYDISKETKEKVIKLARELNYQPNPHASSLRRHSSKTIAVIIPEIANNYFTLVIDGIESVVQEKGYHVMIYLTHEDVSREIAFARTLHNGRVDGALISVSGTSNDFTHFRELQAKGLPMVFFDRVVEDFDTIKVTTDDFESAFLATKHLIDNGCKHIAHLGISKNLSIGKKRLDGYLKALNEHGIPPDDSLIVNCTNDNAKDTELIRNLFVQHKADGIFASVERYAILTYEVCRSLNLSIPDDVKVIGFSNLQTAALLNPSLSTITQPAFEIGREAVTMLLKALEKKNFQLTNENIVIKSSLTQRESTMLRD